MSGPVRVPGPAVVVHGYVAHLFSTVLRRHLPAAVEDLSEGRRSDALAVLTAMEEDAAVWRERVRAEVAAVHGNAALLAAACPAGSDQIATEELATMLGVQVRQARNVGRRNELGVQVGRTWVWSRAATFAHLEQRRSA